jgi:nicotinamidase-related amidase
MKNTKKERIPMNEKTLLVVVDMQEDFIGGVLGTKEAQAIVPKVAEKIRSYTQVLFTADTHQENYLETQEGKILPVPHCIAGTSGHALDPALQPLSQGREILCKGTFGSVARGEKVQALFQQGAIDSVELIGLCTDICVISNALLLKAFCPELPISVDAACCAGVTPERHETALNAMEACQIIIQR